MFKKLFGFGKKDKDKEKEMNNQVEPVEEYIDSLADDLDYAELDEKVSDEEIIKELEELNDNDNNDSEIETDYTIDLAKENHYAGEKEEEDEQSVKNEANLGESPSNEITKEVNKVEKHDVKEKEEQEEKPEKKGFFAKIREGLSKTKASFTDQLNNLFHMYTKIDDDFLDEIEEILITSDMGVELTMDIIDYIKEEVKKNKIEDPNEIKGIIKKYLVNMLNSTKGVEDVAGQQKIIMVVGVNGVGKTTSIGKMSYRLKNSGKSVIVAAGDTFRAAAVEQLKEWCNRSGVDIICSEQGSDPGSVIYDSIQAARARHSDVLICDTAGRLHNKVNLMNELTKIFKIIDKEFAHAQREVLLVVDATTGQNGLIQAKMFKESCDIDGIILTKLDGTAKGGIVFPIVKELNVPIKYIGVGEKIDDLQVFDAEMFVDAIFE